ncbi:MAG: hypothetical protein M3128_02500 [Verrucomicrobiota bacterium]|nr:hypothetical protein [Verrucomicrobiota bacterium]
MLLAGCGHLSPLYQNTTGHVPKSVKPGTGFNIAFIEFGEQGSYLDTSQVEAAVKLVRTTRKPLVISYVHGWHNNAGSGDVNRFSTFLAQIAATPLIRDKGFQVIGVYLGWRGEITDVPVVRQLSFYSRKAAAERLASNFDCFDAISSIAEAARSHPRSEQYTILLGHSFGGLVVERAVAHAIDAEMHGRSHRYNSLPADLTLVLNPASDSILSRQMIAALYQEKTENSRPLFVSITSTADAATGKFFPFGTSIAAVTKAFNQVGDPGAETKQSERAYFTSTPGHNRSLVNHVAKKLDEPYEPPAGLTALEINLSHSLSADKVVLPGQGGALELWQLQRISAVDVPYWDLQVDKSIIASHGDIWNERTKALMAGVFSIANPITPHQRRPEANLQMKREYKRASYKQDKAPPAKP